MSEKVVINSSTCPVCLKLSHDAGAREEIGRLMRGWSFTFNPGGGEFWKPGARLQIHCCCDHCDLERVRRYLGNVGGFDR